MLWQRDPPPRRRRGQPVPVPPPARAASGAARRALCRRSLRRSLSAAPRRRPARGRRPRCERESGAAGMSMDGTVSLAPRPAAPPPRAPVRSAPRRHLPRLCPGARGGCPGSVSVPPLPPPPAAPPGRGADPGAACRVRPAGRLQSPGSGPRAVGTPRRSAAAAGLPRGGGTGTPPAAAAPLSPRFPRDSALRRCRHRPPPFPRPRRVCRAVAALLPRGDPLARRGGRRGDARPLFTAPGRGLEAPSGLSFPGETPALAWSRLACPGVVLWRGGSPSWHPEPGEAPRPGALLRPTAASSAPTAALRAGERWSCCL